MESVDTKQIQQEVFPHTQAAYKKAGFTSKKIARELALIAFSDMKDFVQVDEQGSVKPIAIDSLKSKSRCIKKIREKRRILNGKDDDTILDDTFEFELYSKLDALSMVVDILGHKAPKQVQFPDEDGKPQAIGGIFTDMERATRLVYLLDQASKRAEDAERGSTDREDQ